ncbi:hypothetical protein CBW65_02185 [Tumebacillus avium]|uniref:Uncharacterized protein n=1 Tax=Tumebacillus avium TaxID=1903704 RepID=A0A1Y0IKW8_9BACL|nr:hypothetical protein [Tumebacillus avium]ARU60004.1 hypothetical protein CBW65_02185 [Tumebacillus avium]
MKDPAAFWKFLFMIGLLVAGFFIFFPAFSEHEAEVFATVQNLGETYLDQDVHNILAQLPPARYYVRDVRLSYLPDGTVRDLYVDLLSQPNAQGGHVNAQIHRSKGSNLYRVTYRDTNNLSLNSELDFEDLSKVFTPDVIKGLAPKTPFAYMQVNGTPRLTDLDPHGKHHYYTLQADYKMHHFEPVLYTGTGYAYDKQAGYLFDVYVMQTYRDGHDGGVGKRFLLRPYQ